MAGIDTFRVESLPVTLLVSVMIKVFMQEDERDELEFHVLGPDTTPLQEPLRYPLTATPGPNHRPGYAISVVEALDFSFHGLSEGTYSIEIYTDRAYRDPTSPERRRSVFLNVFRGLSPAAG
jgi:hypothetical protein